VRYLLGKRLPVCPHLGQSNDIDLGKAKLL